MKRTNKKGFTLVELVIVIAVIAILAAVLIPTFSSIIRKANTSADIQAARNMNTHLAVAKVTDGVNSILDVYDLFDESGYSVENYKPLTEGMSYYYDKQYNQILYVDDTTGKVLFPDEHKDETQGTHDWFSLSMEITKLQPVNYTLSGNTVTTTVSTGEELAYVIDEYNNNAAIQNLTIDIPANTTIDMMGASSFVGAARGNIQINGNGSTIKNITSNEYWSTNTNNPANVPSNYESAAILATVSAGQSVTISDVVFENLNVRAIDTGNVALLIGAVYTGANVTIENVTIRNSSVVGQRGVGALIGTIQWKSSPATPSTVTLGGNIVLDNVEVLTVGGKSGLLIGFLGGNTDSDTSTLVCRSDLNLDIANAKHGIYMNAESQQTIYDGVHNGTHANCSNIIENQDKSIESVKTFNADGSVKAWSTYGYKEDALILFNVSPQWKSASTLVAGKTYSLAHPEGN